MNTILYGSVTIKDSKFMPMLSKRQFNLPIIGKILRSDTINGKVICSYVCYGKEFALVTRKDQKIKVHFNVKNNLLNILNEKSFVQTKPIFSHLPFHYHTIPGFLRKIMGTILFKIESLLRTKNEYIFPNWPVEQSVYFLFKLTQLLGYSDSPFLFPRLPNNKKYFLCLTHDIDSKQGYNKLDKFLDIEEKYGYCSTSYIPGNRYKVDFNKLMLLIKKGFEIGIHGYNHGGKLAFSSKKDIDNRLKESVLRFKKMGIVIEGYRATSFMRTPRLFKSLENYFRYDTSSPDTLNFQKRNTFNGCGSPYIFKKGKIIELPVTMPDDATLLMSGYSPKDILKIWKEKLLFIKKIGGVVMFINHPEPHFSGNKEMLGIYDKFLKYIYEDKDCEVVTCSKLINHYL